MTVASKTTDWKLIADGQGEEIVRLRAEQDRLLTLLRLSHDPAFCKSVTHSLDQTIARLTDERDRWRALFVAALGNELAAERRFKEMTMTRRATVVGSEPICGWCHYDLPEGDTKAWSDHFRRSHEAAADGYWFVMFEDGKSFAEAPGFGDRTVQVSEGTDAERGE